MSLFSIPTTAQVELALSKRILAPTKAAVRRTKRKSAPVPPPESVAAKLEAELSRAIWRRWKPLATVAFFTRYTCDNCATIVVAPATHKLVRWGRTDDPAQQWFIEAHEGLDSLLLESLPQETHIHDANAVTCPACWPPLQVVPGQLDLFNGEPTPPLPEHMHPHPKLQRHLFNLLAGNLAIPDDDGSVAHEQPGQYSVEDL